MAKHGNLPKKYMEKATGNPRPRTVVTNGSDAAGREDLFRDQNQDTFMPCLHTQRDSAAWEVNTICAYSLPGDLMLRAIT